MMSRESSSTDASLRRLVLQMCTSVSLNDFGAVGVLEENVASKEFLRSPTRNNSVIF